MPDSLLRKLIDSVMPKGSIWSVKIDGFFDALLNALADSLNTVKIKLAELADIRNAKTTTLLDELERDYGVSFNPDMTESERRIALDSRINAIDNTGSREELERVLQRAGFPLSVYANSPAIDPKDLNINYLMVAGNNNAFAGVSTAIAGAFTSDIIVNGDIIFESPSYSMMAGGGNNFAGNTGAFAGITGFIERFYEYFLPNNPEKWPFVFFVGGDAEFAMDGTIVNVERVNISDNRRLELREIILKYKPTFTWCVLFVDYI